MQNDRTPARAAAEAALEHFWAVATDDNNEVAAAWNEPYQEAEARLLATLEVSLREQGWGPNSAALARGVRETLVDCGLEPLQNLVKYTVARMRGQWVGGMNTPGHLPMETAEIHSIGEAVDWLVDELEDAWAHHQGDEHDIDGCDVCAQYQRAVGDVNDHGYHVVYANGLIYFITEKELFA